MSATEYIAARQRGETTCEEFTCAAVKRMLHYRHLNAFTVSSYEMTSAIIAQARALDAQVEAEGIESIAPLYGLPVPIKGTAATIDFPSSAGSAVLDRFHAARDCDLVLVLKGAHAVIMGKTNVPEFAASWLTLNYTNGVTWNPYTSKEGAMTVGGSSGGAAVAVAANITPLAVTEDTGGSTRHPANQCANFGYDPPRNKYPNDGELSPRLIVCPALAASLLSRTHHADSLSVIS
jgi:amidase